MLHVGVSELNGADPIVPPPAIDAPIADTVRPSGRRRLRVLYLVHRIPFPPDKGDKIRSHRWLTHLCAHHDVWCAFFVDDHRDFAHVSAIRALCRDVLAVPLRRTQQLRRGVGAILRSSLLGDETSTTTRIYHDATMLHAIRKWSRILPFDAVLAFSSAMAPYALRVDAAHRVLDLCDCDSAKWSQYAAHSRGPAAWLFRSEARRLQQEEARWRQSFDRVLVINEKERLALASNPDAAGHRAGVSIVGNGVTLTHATPVPRAPIVTFVGALDYRANVDGVVWFARSIWPLIHAARPAAEFHIVGRRPAAAVRALGGIAGVRLIGEVQSVAPHFRATRVCVAPLRISRGVQNKVLEAFAHARPVVATSGVAQGLDGAGRRLLRVADSADQFAVQVIRLLDHHEECAMLGGMAFDLARQSYAWDRATAALDAALTPIGVSERGA